mmetsp:Transcript_4698/g.6337  ORF Transcript_4698/g.6337 Transcript_4698/m.6337 type:complete len:307 (+) Transcript_4698:202-1122(+)
MNGIILLSTLGSEAFVDGFHIVTWVNIEMCPLLIPTVTSIFVTRVVRNSEMSGCSPCNFTLNAQSIVTSNDTYVTHLTPVLSPRVANDPILVTTFGILAPSNDRYNVIHHLMPELGVPHNTTLIVNNWLSIDSRRNRSSSINLGLNSIHIVARNDTVLCNSRIREGCNLDAVNVLREATTGTTSIKATAGSINISTETLLRISTAGDVRLARIKRNVTNALYKLIGTCTRSTVARTSNLRATVENKLNGKINLIRGSRTSRNLNTIRQSTHRTMRPATTTVLRNMLIQTFRQVRDPIYIPPRKVLW